MPAPKNPDSFAALFEAAPQVPTRRNYRTGETLDVEVFRVTDNAVFVALDGKREGFIEAEELLGADGRPKVSVGARIAARVVEVDRNTGSVRLSPISPDPIVEAIAAAAPAATGAPVV